MDEAMRHGTTTGRRQRSRNNGAGGPRRNNQRMQVFDSNGPDVRIRGTAHQVAEKYMALAKDAASSGDIVLSESYLQHAEHYQRIINSWGEDVQLRRPQESSGNDVDSGNNEEKSAEAEDDLSLPSSILGKSTKAPSEATGTERTAEMSAG